MILGVLGLDGSLCQSVGALIRNLWNLRLSRFEVLCCKALWCSFSGLATSRQIAEFCPRLLRLQFGCGFCRFPACVGLFRNCFEAGHRCAQSEQSMYVCMYVCMYLCMCIYIYIYASPLPPQKDPPFLVGNWACCVDKTQEAP